MNRLFAFLFFMLFLAGFALVSLKKMNRVPPATENISIVAGAWHAADPARFVQFSVEGTVDGFAGCNRFFGSFIATDQTLEVGPLGSTRMACADADMKLENDFIADIHSARTYHIAGRQLILTSDDGTETALQLVSTEH